MFPPLRILPLYVVLSIISSYTSTCVNRYSGYCFRYVRKNGDFDISSLKSNTIINPEKRIINTGASFEMNAHLVLPEHGSVDMRVVKCPLCQAVSGSFQAASNGNFW